MLQCAAMTVLAGLAASPALALEPDEIALIVNSNVPAGRKMAEYYAQKRHIPVEQIIDLSLSASKNTQEPVDDMLPEEFDQKVVPVVRGFLTSHALDRKITCLVSFWGVPLRIDGRSNSEAERKELDDLKGQLDALRDHLEQQTRASEALAAEIDPTFAPGAGVDLDALARRAETALDSVLKNIVKMPDVPKRRTAFEQMMDLIRDVAGTPAVAEKMSQAEFWPLAAKPPTSAEIIASRDHTTELLKQINAIQAQPSTDQTRARLREIFTGDLGTLNSARLIVTQRRSLDTAESEAAFDSELALLWWPPYPKSKWTLNPLDWHMAHAQLPAHTLMVTRLDAPSERQVRELIDASLRVEGEGLKGEVVLDARGKAATEPGYGAYDQGIRNLGEYLKARTHLTVVLDNKEALIPDDSEKDIAVYCGWYSLRQFHSPGAFSPGAVGFHVASSEMVSLHAVNERGWCRNLINGGVVGTLGPVAEPYLQSFPPSDEFFPLLMTGKLTLAEVYWKTAPWASWMQCCVGDPLYTPYKNNPPLKVEDLPEGLRSAIGPQ